MPSGATSAHAHDDVLSIEQIQRAVVSLAQEYGARYVSLFGSYARGEADAQSDVDLLLDKGAVRGMRVLDFQDELARRLGRNVDVVTTAGASERFLAKIRQDEMTLYETSATEALWRKGRLTWQEGNSTAGRF